MPYDKIKLLGTVTQEQFKPIDEDGKVLRPSNPVFKLVSKEMASGPDPSKIQPKHVYKILHKNLHGFYDQVLQHFSIKKPSPRPAVSPVKPRVFNSRKKGPLTFDLTIPTNEWNQIKPTPVTTMTGQYFTLKFNTWAAIFAAQIRHQLPILCEFIGTRNKVYNRNHNPYIEIQGHCSSCPGIFDIVLARPPLPRSNIIFRLTLQDYDEDVEHVDTRTLSVWQRCQRGSNRNKNYNRRVPKIR